MQEANPIETRNAVNNTSGGFLASLGNTLSSVVSSVAKPAADLYALRLQDKAVSQRYAAETAGANAAAVAAQANASLAASQSSAAMSDTNKKLLIGGAIVAALVVIALIFRRR